MNIFDGMQRTAQTIVVNTMGVVARWIPSDGYTQQEVKVLFREPTENEKVSDHDYRTSRPRIEYFQNEFPGLLEKLDGNTQEEIEVDGKKYLAFRGEMKYDGKTIIVYLDPKEE